MIRRSHSVKERLNSRTLSREQLLSKVGNASSHRNKHYAFSPDEIQFSGPHHEIRIPLPHIKREDIDVSAINGMLLVKGNSVSETRIGANQYILNEKDVWNFETVFDLGEEVDIDRIYATYVHNELVLRLFLCEEGETSHVLNRQIPVK